MALLLNKELSKHIHNVYFGGNWSASCLQEHLTDLDYKIATATPNNCNSILALTYHIHYFVRAVTRVLEQKDLDAKDALSFDHPSIASQKEWDAFIETMFEEAHTFVHLIAQLDHSKWDTIFVDEKYGSYFANIQGVIEHTHYHLGQIVILKRVLTA